MSWKIIAMKSPGTLLHYLHTTGLIWPGKYQTLHLMQLATNSAGNAGISIVF
jgi:hypothetical protein